MAVIRQLDFDMVTPERASAVLARLELDWAVELGFIPWRPPSVLPLSRADNRDWWVGEDTLVSFEGDLSDLPLGGKWSTDSDIRSGEKAWQIAYVKLVLAWNSEKYRHLFDLSEWELALEELVRGDLKEDEVSFSRVKYVLSPDSRPNELPLERYLLRWSSKTGKFQRPRLIREDVASGRRTTYRLNPTDRTIDDLLVSLRSWTRTTVHVQPEKAQQVRTRLMSAVFDRLLHVTDLWYGDRRLRSEPRAVVPRIIVAQVQDVLSLQWAPSIQHVYDVGPGYMVTQDGQFCAMSAASQIRSVTQLEQALPEIPIHRSHGFISKMVVRSVVPFDWRVSGLADLYQGQESVGILRLNDDNDLLHVSAAFEYTLPEGEKAIFEQTDIRQVQSVNETLVQRNLVAEENALELLRERTGAVLPLALDAESALDFLADHLSALPPNWRVEGGSQLKKYKVRGRLNAAVSVPSGIDWLDLKIDFRLGDQSIDSTKVLKAWRSGDRFVRLKDDSLVRLPMEWLKTYGVFHEELEAVRAQHDGKLPSYSAPLVENFLPEAEGDIGGWLKELERLSTADDVPSRPLPSGLDVDLRSYQFVGYCWLSWLREQGFGGVLADDMGLGKTLQAITLLLDEHKTKGDPSLVVAPTSVLHAWQAEANRFAPELNVYVHHGSRRLKEIPDEVDVVVSSYTLLRIDPDVFSRSWRLLFLDEAQRIKNPASHISKTCRNLVAQYRYALTGTPLENRLLELWSIFEYLMPGFFGSRAHFQRRYCTPIERERDAEALNDLRTRIRPFVLRRLKREVAKELPPRQEQVLFCDLGPEQRQLYEKVRNTYKKSVLSQVKEKGVGRSSIPVLEALMRLRQACCDPGLLPFPEAEQVQASAKLDLLESTLENSIAAGHRTLVFSQWTSLLQRVIPRLDAHGWEYHYLDGRTTNRHDLVNRWNEPDGPPVFLISLRAGGAGLNLTGADHVIHLDPWWNPAVEDQATDRAHRIGQVKPVVAYRFVARNTVEEKVLALQEKKRDLFDATVEQGRFQLDRLSQEDIEDLFTEGAEEAPTPSEVIASE